MRSTRNFTEHETGALAPMWYEFGGGRRHSWHTACHYMTAVDIHVDVQIDISIGTDAAMAVIAAVDLAIDVATVAAVDASGAYRQQSHGALAWYLSGILASLFPSQSYSSGSETKTRQKGLR